MIKHIVMWKLKEFAEGADRARNATRLKTELEALHYMLYSATVVAVYRIEILSTA